MQATHTPRQLAAMVVARMTTREKILLLGLNARAALGVENQTPGVARLCIPPLFARDGPAGLAAGASGVTAFPAPIALAATFDPVLARRYGYAIGRQARAQGDMAVQGPGIDVSVFSNWGRNFENLGDSTTLTSVMGAAEVRGIESSGTIAIAKHYGPYAEESSRNQVNYQVSPRTLAEVYLAPFRAAVHAGLSGLMCSVGFTNGVHTCAAPSLFAALRSWGFTGLVRTDMESLTNPAAALRAGVELFKPFHPSLVVTALRRHRLSIATLDRADVTVLAVMFARHDIPSRIRPRDNRTVASPSALLLATAVAARSAVLLTNSGVLPLRRRGVSLALIGAGGAAPLISGGGSSHVHASHVVTPLAALSRSLGRGRVAYDPTTVRFVAVRLGRITTTHTTAGPEHSAVLRLPAHLRGLVDVSLHTTRAAEVIVSGHPVIQVYPSTVSLARVPNTQSVMLHPGTRAVVRWLGRHVPIVRVAPAASTIARAAALAARHRVAIVVVSAPSTEGMDRATLALPGFQDQLVAAVAHANPRTVVVVNSGGPVLMPWLHRAAAVLEAWYPGQVDGAALAAVLTGAVDPSGRLPMVFPVSNASAPMVPLGPWPRVATRINLNASGLAVGEAWYGAHHATPLFPFGYGLSYTTFSRSHPRITVTPTGYRVSVRVRNTGRYPGRDVLQTYLEFPAYAGEPTQLAAFGSVTLKPGATGDLTMSVPAPAFAYWTPRGFVTAPGAYHVRVGTSATDLGVGVPLYAPRLACASPCVNP